MTYGVRWVTDTITSNLLGEHCLLIIGFMASCLPHTSVHTHIQHYCVITDTWVVYVLIITGHGHINDVFKQWTIEWIGAIVILVHV